MKKIYFACLFIAILLIGCDNAGSSGNSNGGSPNPTATPSPSPTATPTPVVFDGYAYINLASETTAAIIRYTVGESGDLTNPQPVTNGFAIGAIDGFLYITNLMYQLNFYQIESDGSLVTTGMLLDPPAAESEWFPSSVGFYGESAYVVDAINNKIWQYTLNGQNGVLTYANQVDTSSIIDFEPYSIYFYQNYSYVIPSNKNDDFDIWKFSANPLTYLESSNESIGAFQANWLAFYQGGVYINSDISIEHFTLDAQGNFINQDLVSLQGFVRGANERFSAINISGDRVYALLVTGLEDGSFSSQKIVAFKIDKNNPLNLTKVNEVIIPSQYVTTGTIPYSIVFGNPH